METIAQDTALTIGAGLASGGIAGVGKGIHTVGRILAYAPRFATISRALRAGTAAIASQIRATSIALRTVGQRLQKYLDARLGIPARNEVGQFHPWAFRPNWLKPHEARPGSHALTTHAGKSDDQLRGRLADDPRLRLASTFTDEVTAETAIAHVLRGDRQRIEDWVRAGEGKLEVDGDAGRVVGRVAARSQTRSRSRAWCESYSCTTISCPGVGAS